MLQQITHAVYLLTHLFMIPFESQASSKPFFLISGEHLRIFFNDDLLAVNSVFLYCSPFWGADLTFPSNSNLLVFKTLSNSLP